MKMRHRGHMENNEQNRVSETPPAGFPQVKRRNKVFVADSVLLDP